MCDHDCHIYNDCCSDVSKLKFIDVHTKSKATVITREGFTAWSCRNMPLSLNGEQKVCLT